VAIHLLPGAGRERSGRGRSVVDVRAMLSALRGMKIDRYCPSYINTVRGSGKTFSAAVPAQ
jgi:hypothetical protein